MQLLATRPCTVRGSVFSRAQWNSPEASDLMGLVQADHQRQANGESIVA